MRKNIIALVTLIGGVLYASIGIKIIIFAINYRQIPLDKYWFSLSILVVVLYVSGIYISATLFQLYSKRELAIVPSALTLGSIIGFGLGYSIVMRLSRPILDMFPLLYKWLNYRSFDSDLRYVLGISLLFSLLGISAACAFEFSKSTFLPHPLFKISIVISINLILYFVLAVSTSFPGVNAPIEIRQKWAYREFVNYGNVVRDIGKCNVIRDKVGKIKFVAPTKGRNIHTSEGGSGDYAEFTLEIAGDEGTGIAYISQHLGGITNLSFEYQGKKAKVCCAGCSH
jgi:hypothetical protein